MRSSATNFQSVSASYRRHYCRKSSQTAMASGVACSLNSTLHKQPRRLQQPGSLGWSVSAAVLALQLHSLVDRPCELNSLPCRSWDYLSSKGLGQESTHKGGNQRSKYVTQAQQQRPQSLPATLTRHACQYKVHKLHQRGTSSSWLGQELFPVPKGKGPLAYQSSGAVRTGRWTWALIPYPILRPVPNNPYGFCGHKAR